MRNESVEAMGISELAERAGVSLRTVRYYVSEGLLPPPGGASQKSVYTREHLLRLEAIKRLKARYLPLAEIRRTLAGMSLVEMEELVRSEPPAVRSKALDYLASIMPGTQAREQYSPPSSVEAPRPPQTQRVFSSVWQHVRLAPGVELQYQLSGNPERDTRIARLIDEATDLLKDLPPAE